MMTSEHEILTYLNANHIEYQRFEHPAVFTCEESELHRPDFPAVSTKNLFLSDKKNRKFYLVVTACEKSVNLSNLTSRLGVSHLHFASGENLQRLLGLTSGSVTMMGLVNDAEKRVELWMDSEIWHGEYFLCHPLINTATLILAKTELRRFINLTQHEFHLFGEEVNRT